MATTSTVPTLRSSLVTKLMARPGLADVQVWRRHPGPNTKVETIWLGDCEGEWEAAALVGRDTRQPRNETYRLQVFVQTFWATYSPTGAADSEDRAYALLAEVEDLLATDADLRSAVLGGSVASFEDETLEQDHGTWATRLTLTVTFHAWLT